MTWALVPPSGAGYHEDVHEKATAVASGDAFELGGGEGAGVALDAALAAAEGDADEGALHGHEEGEGLDVVEVDVLVVAEAALVGSEGVVVLDAVALEEPVVSVVHADGEVDHDLVLGLGEDDADAVLEVDGVCGAEHGGDGLEVEVVGVVGEAELIDDRVAGGGLCLDAVGGVGRGGGHRFVFPELMGSLRPVGVA